MFTSWSLAFIGLALGSPAATDGFVVVSRAVPQESHSRCPALPAIKDPNNGRVTSPPIDIQNSLAASVIALGLFFPSTAALAAQDAVTDLPSNTNALHSSTIGISAEIKTMDFSMPSSYDSIADPVASGTDELTKTTVINTGASGAKKKPAKSAPMKAPAGPSVSAKEASEAARAERVAQREAMEAEKAVRDADAAKERDAAIKAARLEKIAAREAAKEEQEAAEAAAREEAKFKDVKFVDTSMPKY